MPKRRTKWTHTKKEKKEPNAHQKGPSRPCASLYRRQTRASRATRARDALFHISRGVCLSFSRSRGHTQNAEEKREEHFFLSRRMDGIRLRGSLRHVSHPSSNAAQKHGAAFRFGLDVKRNPEKRADGAQTLNTSRRELA